MENEIRPPRRYKRSNLPKIVRWVLGIIVLSYILWRLYTVFIVQNEYTPDIWFRLLLSGLVIGGVYSLIAIGYTLVYGILRMINFAHGEVMMIGTFAGYFVFEATNAIKFTSSSGEVTSLSNAQPVLAVLLAFIVGMTVASTAGFLLEKIAYRPLRKAPRLIPLISAIGASIFLQNLAQLLFSPLVRDYKNPALIARGQGWPVTIAGAQVVIPYTGVLTFSMSIILMFALYTMVKKSKLGKSMRAVAADKPTAALMGIDVNAVISQTFIISGLLAGAAGVMWGLHNGLVYSYVGFLPGIKAFTSAVLGGIGNIPGAMLGGMLLGLIESIGPTALGISYQLKDVLAFVVLIIILVFRPSGILGEVLSEEKV